MSFTLITELTLWFSLLCLLLGAFYAWLFYRRENHFEEVPVWQKRLMAACRFMLVSVLAFLLLSPMVRSITREVEKPVIIIAQDNSASVINNRDSADFKTKYSADLQKLINELGTNYEVRTYSFGDKVNDQIDFDFKDKQTNFSALYDELNVQFANRNVGAMVIASDGLYNEGSNPVYGPSGLKVPVYTIALGDTNVHKELVLSSIKHNRVAFLGNVFPLEVVVDAYQCPGEKTTLTVLEDSTVMFTRNIEVAGNKFHTSVPVLLDAKKKGIHHFTVRLSRLSDEVTYANNEQELFIEVVENKQKILVLTSAPHPDIAALKSAIETSPNYELKVLNIKDFDGRLSDYNLVIMYQLPSQSNAAISILENLKKSEISTWFLLGAASQINSFNNAGAGIEIQNAQNKLNEAQAFAATDFSLFNLSDELKHAIGSYAPLMSPFGVYQSRSNIYTLLTQRIGIVNTQQPLLYFMQDGNRKIGVLCGEGLWKWRLNDFKENNTNALSNELITRIVQYLSAKENRSPFRLNAKTNFRENEPLVFDAEMYNESDQLINEPEVRMTINNSSGKQFPFTFSRTDKAYTLNAGLFPVGQYKFKAETKLGDKLYVQNGEFSVSALQLETSNTVADHQLLYSLSNRTGGQLFYPAQMDQLLKSIQAREDVKPVSYQHKKLKDLVTMPLVFVLILLLVSIEWFLRKRNGSY